MYNAGFILFRIIALIRFSEKSKSPLSFGIIENISPDGVYVSTIKMSKLFAVSYEEFSDEAPMPSKQPITPSMIAYSLCKFPRLSSIPSCVIKKRSTFPARRPLACSNILRSTWSGPVFTPHISKPCIFIAAIKEEHTIVLPELLLGAEIITAFIFYRPFCFRAMINDI